MKFGMISGTLQRAAGLTSSLLPAFLYGPNSISHYLGPILSVRLGQKLTLASLPHDVLEEVLSYLDIQTLISSRLTCRTLRDATKSRRLWLGLIHILQLQQVISRLEEPVDNYTTEELEGFVVRYARVSRAWGTAPKFRQRTLRGSHFWGTLLPGGRWLLSLNTEGRLSATDLNAAQPEPKTLVQFERGKTVPDLPGTFSVWVDPNAAYLTVRVALYTLGFLSEEEPGRARTRIHLYDLRLTGHGAGASLVAEHLQTIRGVFPGSASALVMDDKYLIHFRGCTRSGSSGQRRSVVMHVFLVSELLVVENIQPVTVVLGPAVFPVSDCYILPHDRIAVVGEKSTVIYPIPTVSSGWDNQWDPLYAIPLVINLRPLLGATRSPLFVNTQSTTIVYISSGDLATAQIPHDHSAEPSVKKVIEFPGSAIAAVHTGLCSSVVCWKHLDREVLHICVADHSSLVLPSTYDDLAKAECTLTTCDIPGTAMGLKLGIFGFEAGTGRLVIHNKWGEIVEIYDVM